MSITPVHTFGPALDTASSPTIAYTLAGGESIAAGSFGVLAVSAAAPTAAVAQSAADSKGNVYTVDAGISPAGSVAASLVSVQFVNALAAGDVITVTLNRSSTDKRLDIDVITGAATLTAKDISATGSLASPGSTTPTLSASPGPTSQTAEIAYRHLVWNGVAALTTPDANYDAVVTGHFDNGGVVKQMSLRRKIYSVVTTPGVADVIAAAQPWAVVVVTYKASTAPPASTAKLAARGLSTRDGEKPPAGYDAAFSNRMIDVAWGAPNGLPGGTTQAGPLQPAEGGPLDTSELSRLDALVDLAAGNGDTVTFRIFAGRFAPAWLKTKVGTFRYADTAGTTPTPDVAMPKFWTTAYLDAYQDFQSKLAAHYDGGSSPTTRQAAVRGIQQAAAMTYYAEPFQRHPGGNGGAHNRAEMVGGGNGWAGTHIDAPGAGFSFAADKAAQKRSIDIHAACWPNTPCHVAFNPWQVLYSQAEAGFTYVGDNQTFFGSDVSDLSNTFEIIDYMVAKLGSQDLVVLEQNSFRSNYLNADGTLDVTSKIGKLYQKFLSLPYPKYYQTANASNIGDFNKAMTGLINKCAANAVEPAHNSGASPYTESQLAGWDVLLRANPLPAGGPTPHKPTNITLPAITVSAGGYTPGQTVTVDMGTWDAGSHAITARSVTWYRKAAGTGLLQSVRGPTAKTTNQDTDTYTIQAGDLAFTLEPQVTYTNADGATTAIALDTPTIITPAAPAPTNITLPAITPAAPKVGDVLTADPGSWTGNPTSFNYQFLRSLDSGATYSLVQSGSSPQYQTTLVGALGLFEVTVTANNGQDSLPATSAPTAALVSSPTITLTAPGAASLVLPPGITAYQVAGIATPAEGTTISTVTVNGTAVSVGSDGSFSRSVSLGVGATIITAIATDVDGGTASAVATIFVPVDALVVSVDGQEIELRLFQRSLL